MAPNQIHEKIRQICSRTSNSRIAVHCHNDMGMACANSVMGIVAGGAIIEASALGIGERNGIADLYTTAKTLQDQGFDINLDTDDLKTFKAYYEYVDSIIYEQTSEHFLTRSTPIFGNDVKTHVAGTHANTGYGIMLDEQFFLNILCGKHLVKKYLESHNIDCPMDMLDLLTLNIKSKSAQLNSSLTQQDIKAIIASLVR